MIRREEICFRGPIMKRRVIYISILRFLLFFQAGCSIVTVDTGSLKDTPDVYLINPDDGPYSIEVIQRKDGSRDYWWEIESRVEQADTCRVKYHSLYSTNRFMVVQGKVGNTGNRYPVVLDTGSSQAVFVKDTHVLNNDLPIYPMETNKLDLNGYQLGLCHLPKLQIGNALLIDQPCFYLERNVKLGLFGLAIVKDNFKDDSIIVGLPALQQFKYIMFDSVKKEVEFSHSKLFRAEKLQLWEQHSFIIEEDFHGNAFLFVRIPISGKQIELKLDTGSGRGLAISEDLWQGIRGEIHDVKLRKQRDIYPYIGSLACERGVIPKLRVGNRMVKNAKVSIFPNESKLLEQNEGLIGMQLFRDTVMVLDFERNIMWVKNQEAK
jgi:hypothetical protein